MIKKYTTSGLFIFLLLSTFPLFSQEKPKFLIRCDDIGMCHSVNEAITKVLETNIPISASVMVTCPWFMEAVEILNKYPHVSIGIHLTLNAEWKNYRWGPVLGPQIVPSLVDSLGYFFPSRGTLFANNPKTEEVELELRAQIEKALQAGLKIDYLDYHMGAAVQTPELRAVVEKLAHEYKLGIAQYFGEKYSSVSYRAKIGNKADSLVARIENLGPGELGLQVVHLGLDSPEMAAMQDLNLSGPKDMSRQRAGELSALLSIKVKNALKSNNIEFVTYRDLIEQIGLENMKPPSDFD